MPPDGITWQCLPNFRINTIFTEMSIYALVLGAACQPFEINVYPYVNLGQEKTHDVVKK